MRLPKEQRDKIQNTLRRAEKAHIAYCEQRNITDISKFFIGGGILGILIGLGLYGPNADAVTAISFLSIVCGGFSYSHSNKKETERFSERYETEKILREEYSLTVSFRTKLSGDDVVWMNEQDEKLGEQIDPFSKEAYE